MVANELGDLLLEVLPPDGSTLENLSARQAFSKAAEREVGEEEYEQVREKLLVVSVFKESCQVRTYTELPLVEEILYNEV